MPADSPAILIAYDGSAGAEAAIDEAGRLFPGWRAVVVSVWWSVRSAAPGGRVVLPDEMIRTAVENLDAAACQVAADTAERGVEQARAAGLDAGAAVERADPNVAATLVRMAHDREVAAVVVVGSRGRSGLRAALLGSVSNAVVHHCRRPVLVVHPSAEPMPVFEPEPAALP